MIYGCVWLHNVICGTCVITNIERRMLGDEGGFMNPIFDLFGIPNTDELSNPIFVLIMTVMMLFFTIQLFGLGVRQLRIWFR